MSKLKIISEKISHNDSPIVPLGYRVLIKMDKINEKTEGGIIITTNAKELEEAGNQTGRIVDNGPAAFTTGVVDLPNEWDRKPEIGARVIFNRYAGIRVFIDDLPEGEYRLMSDKEILAIIGE